VWIAVGGASATITVSCAIGVAVSHGAIDVADDDVADDDVVAWERAGVRHAVCSRRRRSGDRRAPRASAHRIVWIGPPIGEGNCVDGAPSCDRRGTRLKSHVFAY
jgi:hypothetical protein